MIYGDKMSNSGKALKFKIPNNILNYGWINYSGMVKILKICENKMGNRGSKLILNNFRVIKEQRVDGNWFVNPFLINLRCTLNGFERNSIQDYNPIKVKISSKQFDYKTFSTSTFTYIHPLSGLIDGEDKKKTRGWRV